MKKSLFYLIAVLLLTPSTLVAQLQVQSDGTTKGSTFFSNTIKNNETVFSKRLGLGVSTSETPESDLAVGNKGNSYTTAYLLCRTRIGINVNTAPQPNGAIGIQSFAINSVSNPYIPYNPHNIAVRAIAGEKSSIKDVRSYGVSALLHGPKGTALYAGTTPYEFTHNGKYAAYIYGDATVQNGTLNAVVTQYNDTTLMQETKPLGETDLFDKLGQLQGIQYSLVNTSYTYPFLAINGIPRDTTLNRFSDDLANRTHYGFSPTTFKEVFPEMVYTLPDQKEGVDYAALVPLLAEGLKLEHRTTQMLQDSLSQLSAQLQQTQTLLIETISELEALKKEVYGTPASPQAQGDAPSLSQNTPNPFTESTEIDIHLPADVQTAWLFVYNLAGEQQQEFQLNERGDTSVTIEGSSLSAGHYIYTLVVDGQIIDSKHLILTR